MEKKIMSLMENEEFKSKLNAAETLEEVAELLRTEGIEVTAEQLEQAMNILEVTDGELTEEALAEVAGGFPWVIIGIAAMIYGVYTLCRTYKKAVR